MIEVQAMEEFRIIYRILRAIKNSMDYEEFDTAILSPEALKCSEEKRDKLLIQLQDSGYISGLRIARYLRQPAFIQGPISPEITIKGLEYLEENSLMKKAANLAKGVVDTIK